MKLECCRRHALPALLSVLLASTAAADTTAEFYYWLDDVTAVALVEPLPADSAEISSPAEAAELAPPEIPTITEEPPPADPGALEDSATDPAPPPTADPVPEISECSGDMEVLEVLLGQIMRCESLIASLQQEISDLESMAAEREYFGLDADDERERIDELRGLIIRLEDIIRDARQDMDDWVPICVSPPLG